MSPSIGANLRVTGHCNQGGRQYMEDVFTVAYQQTEDDKDLEFAYFGIFDGHGGREAALFAKEHLMDAITRQDQFWSLDDDSVLKAIREGFLQTQQAMWSDLPKWKKTKSGLPSTAGTTASVCFIKRGKLFIGHCGDSGIILAEEDPYHAHRWRARALTTDHKPESEEELRRIEQAGGKVVSKSGVPRVVWYRPRGDHQGPVRRSTPIDEVPFLAVARALGDLWSYNAKDDVFIVSPDPDLHVYDLDVLKHRALILATDGAWNVLSPDMAVQSVLHSERNNEKHMIDPEAGHTWLNPSKCLVDLAINRWNLCQLRADNTSIVTVMLDPPGPPRAQVLRKNLAATAQTGRGSAGDSAALQVRPFAAGPSAAPALPPKPKAAKSISIFSRFPNSANQHEKTGTDLVAKATSSSSSLASPTNQTTRIVQDSAKPGPQKVQVSTSNKVAQRVREIERADEPERSPKLAASRKEPVGLPVREEDSPKPPLPERKRPAESKKPVPEAVVASAKQAQQPTNSPAMSTRSRQRQGEPIAAAAALVKQHRRSIPAAAGSSAADDFSDEENSQPRRTRRSGGATSSTTALTTVRPAGVRPSASSAPTLVQAPTNTAPVATGSQEPTRALRPRNSTGPSTPDTAPTQKVANQLKKRVTRSASVFQKKKSSTLVISDGGGVKRKRRSCDPMPSKLAKTTASSSAATPHRQKGGSRLFKK